MPYYYRSKCNRYCAGKRGPPSLYHRPPISRPEIYGHFPFPVWQIADGKKKKKQKKNVTDTRVYDKCQNRILFMLFQYNAVVCLGPILFLSTDRPVRCVVQYCNTTNAITRACECENWNRFPGKREFVNRPDFEQIFSELKEKKKKKN